MRALLTYLFALIIFHTSVMAQVEIDNSIDLNGALTTDKQIKNLANPTTADNAVPAYTDQNGNLIFGEATGIDTLLVSLEPAITAYEPGLMLNIKTSNSNDNAIYIDVNGLGPIQVLNHINESIDSAQVVAGQVLSVIFDGQSFQLLSELDRPCPNGFVEVNDQYCIETAEQTGNQWYWDVVTTCYDQNARLCTWGEWYYACQKSGLSVTGMTNNWEWTSTVANNPGQVKLVGNGSCQVGLVGRTSDQKFKGRCCYSR